MMNFIEREIDLKNLPNKILLFLTSFGLINDAFKVKEWLAIKAVRISFVAPRLRRIDFISNVKNFKKQTVFLLTVRQFLVN